MKKISTFLLVCSLFLGLGTTTTAQKYGHLNLGNLLATLPEAKVADEQLVSEQKKLSEAFEVKVKAYKTRYNKALEEVQKGTVSQIDLKKKEQALQKEEQALAKEEQDIVGKISKKRQDLLGPILEKVQKAIEAVAKENNYVMIFDTSVINTVLFAKDSDDVMDLVKKKLETM